MLTDRLGKELKKGDRVAYSSFKLNNMEFGVILDIKRTRAVIQSIRTSHTGIIDYRPLDDIIESVSGYDIMKVLL